MSTVVVGIKALLSSGEKLAHLAKKGADLIAAAEANPSALARFEETSAEATREMLKDSYAAVRALVAYALDRDPSDAEVDAVFAEVAEHPNAPFRFHRLLGEARKSASRRRRRFLASVFFGLPFTRMPDDERDRVDMVVERMVPEDVDLLVRIERMNRAAGLRPQLRAAQETRATFLVEGTMVVIRSTGEDIRTLSGAAADLGQTFLLPQFTDEMFHADQSAFGSLQNLGCIDVTQRYPMQTTAGFQPLYVTKLGLLVTAAIEEVLPGFDGVTE